MSEVIIDDRTGSGDIAEYLRDWCVPYYLTRLPYGDAAVSTGDAPLDPPVVGVEIKRVKDALQCMRDGRFAGHQLPGLLATYSVVYLIVEGEFDVDYDTGGMIEHRRGKTQALGLGRNGPRFLYKEFDHWLITMEVKAGLHVRRTTSRTETAKVIADLRTWWEKPWDSHKGHLALHPNRPDRALLVKPSVTRIVAAQLPGVGWERSKAVEAHFGTIECMSVASVKEWAEVDGIGKTMAERIVAALTRRNGA